MARLIFSKEVSDSHDRLTIEWMKQDTVKKLKINEHRE